MFDGQARINATLYPARLYPTCHESSKPSSWLHDRPYNDAFGLFCRMFSISPMTSGVILGSNFKALQLSWTC